MKNKPLTNTEKIQLLNCLLVAKEGEDAKFWVRYNLFLVLISALLIASFVGKGSALDIKINDTVFSTGGLLLGLFGLALSVTWLKLLTTSKTYITRWIADIDYFLEKEPQLLEIVKGYSDKSSRITNISTKKATTYARRVILLYCLLWGCTVALKILELFI